jgi:paraquat-inducible protein B
MDVSGIQISTESVISILVGGIAFDTFKNNSDPEEQASEDSIFKLFPSREAV